MALAVVQGATLRCTCGSTPSQLLVTSQALVFIDHKWAATVEDRKPVLNVLPFGACKALKGPCAPAFAAPWIPGSRSVVEIGNHLALLSSDMLLCTAAAGTVTITDPGQKDTEDT